MNIDSTHNSSVSLSINQSVLEGAITFVDNIAINLKLGKYQANILRLVTEELVSNSVNHGEIPDKGTIDISISCNDGALCIEFIDDGKPFNPSSDLANNNLDSPADKRYTGGLGWAMVNHYFEIKNYYYTNNRNYLILSEITKTL